MHKRQIPYFVIRWNLAKINVLVPRVISIVFKFNNKMDSQPNLPTPIFHTSKMMVLTLNPGSLDKIKKAPTMTSGSQISFCTVDSQRPLVQWHWAFYELCMWHILTYKGLNGHFDPRTRYSYLIKMMSLIWIGRFVAIRGRWKYSY